MNLRAFRSVISSTTDSLPIVILYVTSACNLRCITCSYRDALPNELSLEEYAALAQELKAFGLQHVVFSGGEPLVRRDLPAICEIFAALGVRQSLLTNGLLLEKRIGEMTEFLNEIIVSVDGPDAATHNSIRGLECFDQILRGIEVVKRNPRQVVLSLRTVVQRRNFRLLDSMVDFARNAGADRLSFLSADVRSSAFHRNHGGPAAPESEILLTAEECGEFRKRMTAMIGKRRAEIRSGFISESPGRLMHLVRYFEAFHGLSGFPRNSCNAPNISTVITSTGELLPCYFLPAYGDVRSGPLQGQINNDLARFTRRQVRAYALEQCRKCVCTLRVSPWSALRDKI